MPPASTPTMHLPPALLDACTAAGDIESELPAVAASGDYIGAATVAKTYADKLSNDLPALAADAASEVRTLISDLNAVAQSASEADVTSNVRPISPHIVRFVKDFCGAR